jgi:hypothetical protein
MKKALAALLFLLLPGSAGYPHSPGMPVYATAIQLDPADPERVRIGGLRYLGGWHLTSRERNFGGYSSLSVKGDSFYALADTGDFLKFRMTVPGEIRDVRFGTLPAFPAYSGNRSDRDSESMTIGPQGDVWVGFEYHNAVLRYSPDMTKLVSMAWPEAMRKWARNSGPEAMTRLEGGRFVIFAEGMAIAPHVHAALMFPGDPTNLNNVPFQFGYKPPQDYGPTDTEQMPDGRLIILQRHFGVFDGFWSAISIVDPTKIVPGAVVEGELVAELKPPLNIDNMEGMSITREGDRTIIWLISDDNQVPVERTLLLKFELIENRK